MTDVQILSELLKGLAVDLGSSLTTTQANTLAAQYIDDLTSADVPLLPLPRVRHARTGKIGHIVGGETVTGGERSAIVQYDDDTVAHERPGYLVGTR